MTTRQEDLDDDPPARNAGGFLSPALVGFSALTILTLLVAVIGVGLARDNLDTTAVATILCTLFSGIVVGTLYQHRDRGGRGES